MNSRDTDCDLRVGGNLSAITSLVLAVNQKKLVQVENCFKRIYKYVL